MLAVVPVYCLSGARFASEVPLAAAQRRAPFRSGQPSHRRTARRQIRAQASRNDRAESTRRGVLLGLAAVASTASPTALAHASPLAGLRTFLQSRQEIYAIAPIGVGQRKLKEAAELLASAQGETSRREALNIIRAASFNCHSYESRGASTLDAKASLIQQSIQQSFPKLVDPCTYRLIAKNVTKLVLDNEADLRDEVDGSLAALLRSFNLLDEALDAALDGDESATAKVEGRMQATRDNMDRFDRSIRQCLHMA